MITKTFFLRSLFVIRKQIILLVSLFMIIGMSNAQTPDPGTLESLLNLKAGSMAPNSKGANTNSIEATGLSQVFSATGQYTLSADGGGSTASSMTISVNKPNAAATVHKAILMSAVTLGTIGNGCVTISGVPVNWNGSASSGTLFNNYWADVTSIVEAQINGFPVGISNLTLTECNSSKIEGEALLVIFNDAAASEKTIIIMFGAASPTGDNFSVTLSQPIDPSQSGALLDMGLGIGFGFQLNAVNQFSHVSVNGQRLSSSAGGEDDGASANGALITVGGIDDVNTNPANPFAGPANPRSDDELYNILPFITNTTTSLTINTLNPSNDDNIFLAYFSISGAAIIGEGILLSQTTSSGNVGTTHTVNAVVKNNLGQPLPGKLVTFTITSGPNTGAGPFSATTDVNGEANFTYTGSGGAGTDNIVACFMNSQNQLTCSNTLTFLWIEPNCSVNASAGPGGSISLPGVTAVTCGSRLTYTITPDPCYLISDVLIDGVSDPATILSGSYTFNNIVGPHTIYASFVLNGPFDIVATSGGNGSVTPSGTTSVACGGNQTYMITPDPGYLIFSVLIDGVNDPGAVTSGSYTFTNVQMNQTIHATFVTECSPTTVTITASQDSFCANLTLTANPATPGAYTYEWKRGAFVVGTSQTLVLTTASSDGVYTVTAASGPSCVSAPATYTFDKENSLQSYTILAINEFEMGENNTVLNGSVGNMKAGGKMHIKKYAWIASPGSFAKGTNLKVEAPSNVPIRIYAPAVVTLPAMQYNTTSTSGLSNISIPKTSLPSTYTGNYKDITVKKGTVTTLTGSIFGKIKLEEGAKVTFTSPELNIQELEMHNGTSSKLTELNFAADCNVRSKKRVKVEENCRINTTASKNVVFYVDTEKFEVKAQNTNITASVYAPTKQLHVNGNGPSMMIGRFIAYYIDVHAKNVTWNNFDCTVPPVAPRTAPSTTAAELISKMEMQVYPNPTSNYFNLKLKTAGTDEVRIKVFEISGKLIQEIKGMPGQIFRLGDGLLPGIYFAELRQGNENVMVKLVKQK